MPRRHIAPLLLSLLLAIATLLAPVYSQEKAIGEDTLKALYSYKFALFTEWPESSWQGDETSFAFCIIGNNPFSQMALENIQDKPIKNRSIRVEIYNSGVLAEESLSNCKVAFISESEVQRLPAILNFLRRFPILSISDISNFSLRGGMITLLKEGDHIQFEINPEALTQSGLTISSKIMELAKLVKQVSPEGR